MSVAGADPEIFQRGVEEENFERKMFVDTRINACTHKNQTKMQLFLSSSFSRGLSSIFCFVFFFFFFFYMYDYGNWLLNKPNFVSLFSTSGQRFFKLRCEEIRNFHPQIFDVDLIRKLSPSVIDPGIKYLTLPALTFILKVNLF